MFNSITVAGRLTTDPKFSETTNSSVARFTLAVDRNYINKNGVRETDFIPILVWGKQAVTVKNYLNKGKLILVQGSLQVRKYTDKNNTEKYISEIISERITFLERVEKLA